MMSQMENIIQRCEVVNAFLAKNFLQHTVFHVSQIKPELHLIPWCQDTLRYLKSMSALKFNSLSSSFKAYSSLEILASSLGRAELTLEPNMFIWILSCLLLPWLIVAQVLVSFASVFVRKSTAQFCASSVCNKNEIQVVTTSSKKSPQKIYICPIMK